MVSTAGADVCRMETGIALAGPGSLPAMGLAKAEWVGVDDVAAAAASGTGAASAMAIVPCSMSTLGALASGAGRNLIHRAADVMLKERRPLVVVPRETPLNEIHLRNMLRLHRAGAVILPASPAFYTRPGRVEDLVDHLVSRILSVMGFDVPPGHRWNGPPSR
jgi:4-hydroxy-3-polyprenylbenzoate decarboxylase